MAADVACLVIVDVLSFSTAVSVAVEAGTAVYPFPWRDERASRFAADRGAALAVGRSMTSPATPWTLSPASLRAAPYVARLVLPSPNGSRIASVTNAARTVAACLRNARSTADWLVRAGYGTPERPIAVVAAGERHADGGLRPALEDLLGAGAIIAALRAHRELELSPEADAAAAAFTGTSDVRSAVARSASGRELVERGFAADVDIAIELDASQAVAVLIDGAFAAPSDG